jgi:hypothetical protein
MKFLKKGKEAQTAKKKEAKKQEENNNGIFRFWIPDETDTAITFLDGELDDDGVLDNGVYYEHQLQMNGHWKNWFVCIEDEAPCPICATGDQATLVAPFLIVDHSEWEDSKGVKHKNELKLFIAKAQTMKTLQKLATKRGGLAGCKFDVSRSGDKAANVGNIFDFEHKHSVKACMKKYKIKALPKYEDIIIYRDAAELATLGFGDAGAGAGSQEDVPWEEDEGFDDDDI